MTNLESGFASTKSGFASTFFSFVPSQYNPLSFSIRDDRGPTGGPPSETEARDGARADAHNACPRTVRTSRNERRLKTSARSVRHCPPTH